ncbi:MAG: histidine kinase [Lachnospiraceae bacterium]|nr:histidine kinase [Lachnospiraceae bacterium]
MRNKRKRNLFQRLSIGLFSILISISVALTAGFSIYYKQQADESVYESIRQVADNNASNISKAFSQMEMAINTLNSENSGIREKIMYYEGDSKSLVQSFYQTIELLENYIDIALQSFTNKYHVYFFMNPEFEVYEKLTAIEIEGASLDGNAWVYSDELVCDEEWFQWTQENPNQSLWLTMGDDNEKLCMVRSLQYMRINNNYTVINEVAGVETVVLGVIFIAMDTSWIREHVDASELSSDTIFWLTDKDGNILYTSDPKAGEGEDLSWLRENIGANQLIKLQDEKYAVEVNHVTQELDLVTLVPDVEVQQNYFRSLLPFFMLLAAALLLGGGISILFSRRMTRDILFLAQHMRNTKITPIESIQSIQDEDISILYESYNTLIYRVEESARIQMEHMEEMRRMELNLMQAQINPHFLCNSLNSVYNVAVLHNEETIANAVQGLCTFLRYNVSAPNFKIITIIRQASMINTRFISTIPAFYSIFNKIIYKINKQHKKTYSMLSFMLYAE